MKKIKTCIKKIKYSIIDIGNLLRYLGFIFIRILDYNRKPFTIIFSILWLHFSSFRYLSRRLPSKKHCVPTFNKIFFDYQFLYTMIWCWRKNHHNRLLSRINIKYGQYFSLAIDPIYFFNTVFYAKIGCFLNYNVCIVYILFYKII